MQTTALNRREKVGIKVKPANLKMKTTPYIMVAPATLLFILFFIIPIFYMIYLSFFSWDMLGDMEFIGIENYKELYNSAEFREVIGNTFQYTITTVSLTIIIALALALFLRKNTAINRFMQSVVFAPYVIALSAIAFIWM